LNKTFKALSDPTRREILKLLSKSDLSANEIVQQFNMSQPSISKHLEILKQAQLVTAEKKGQFVIYSINLTVLQSVLGGFLQLFENGREETK
jgi:DNA-binding transcriptional ArsR family regulator